MPVSMGKIFVAARKQCLDQDQQAFLIESNALLSCRGVPFVIQLFQDHEEETTEGGEPPEHMRATLLLLSTSSPWAPALPHNP